MPGGQPTVRVRPALDGRGRAPAPARGPRRSGADVDVRQPGDRLVVEPEAV